MVNSFPGGVGRIKGASKRGEAPLPNPTPLLRDALPGEGDTGGEVEK